MSPGAERVLRAVQNAANSHGLNGAWAGLLAELLRICRDRTEAYWSAHDRDPEVVDEFVTAFARDVESHLRSTRASSVTHEHAEFLEPLIDAYDWEFREELTNPGFTDASDVLLARGMALGIDEGIGSGLEDWFRTRWRYEVQEREPFLRAGFNVTPLVGGHASTPPDRRPTARIDYTRRIGIGDHRANGYRIIVDWDLSNTLADLPRSGCLKVACCQPFQSLNDFDIEWSNGGPESNPETNDTPTVLRNQGPREGRDAREPVTAVIDQVTCAADSGAHIVLIPEYCLRDVDRRQVLAALNDLGDLPIIVVGGSSEVSRGGRIVNEAVIWARRRPSPPYERTIQKVHPGRAGNAVEAISPDNRAVRVFMSGGGWALVVLICADAMSADLVQVLAELGVNLALVIAMTERTVHLVRNTSSLVAGSQAFTIVANAPTTWSDTHGEVSDRVRAVAAFDAPRADTHGPLIVLEADVSGRYVVVFESDPPRWSVPNLQQ